MRININELVPNPINPRVIGAGKKESLLQSIILFPKMLEVRDVIINKDNVVLSGNMRLNCLNNILATQNIRDLVAMNSKFSNMGEEEQNEIITYWDKWQDNPLVKVTVADISLEDQKELIIKDNMSYGEFLFDELLKDFREEELVEFGMNESDFYKIDEDDTVQRQRDGSAPVKITQLSFGDKQINISVEEYYDLKEAFDRYVEDLGTSYGFISNLRKRKNGDN